MKRELAIDISRVTEAASLAAAPLIGRGQKEEADLRAVLAMRHVLDELDFSATVVIGEGEIDNAPMLYIGEELGRGQEKVEIAIDPIDGTRMVATGQENAVSVIVIAPEGSLLNAPDMYMEKIMVGFDAKGAIDIEENLQENIKNVAHKLNKKITEMTVLTLYKPRHFEKIKIMQEMGVKVIAIPDGDVAGSILVGVPNSGIDMFYGIGGAPEGVISAAIMQALNGDMQARLILRKDCKGESPENIAHSEIEQEKCLAMGTEVNQKLKLEELCLSDNIIMSVTGITDGTLLKGVKFNGDYATTETMLIRGKTRTIRKIESTHFLKRKDERIQGLIYDGE